MPLHVLSPSHWWQSLATSTPCVAASALWGTSSLKCCYGQAWAFSDHEHRTTQGNYALVDKRVDELCKCMMTISCGTYADNAACSAEVLTGWNNYRNPLPWRSSMWSFPVLRYTFCRGMRGPLPRQPTYRQPRGGGARSVGLF